jgi:glutamate racemase
MVVVDSARATATALGELLTERGLDCLHAQAKLELLVTDVPGTFRESASRFLGASTAEPVQVDIPVSR